MSNYPIWLDGKPVEGVGEIQVVNPATENIFASIGRSDQAMADKAIASAKAAQKQWANLPMVDRQAALLSIADLLHGRAEEIARVLTMEQGKPMAESTAEVAYTEAFIRHFATLDLPVEVIQDDEAKRVELHRKALGVVACIIPWNFPLLIISFKAPLALLAGNGVVLKPSPTTPLTAAIFAEICSQALPAGLLNTVNDENDLGAYLTQHPDIAKISFTGSTETGRRVMESASGTLKRLTLELGGNDPGIVLPDVDVKETAARIFDAAFMNCGQVCLALKRAYVHESIYDEVCDELGALANAVVIGDGLESETQIGPLNNLMQYNKVKSILEKAANAGTIVAGGQVPDGKGFFIRPTIVRDVCDGDDIVDLEQFGPILPVISYSSVDTVIASANGLEFGLGASVWSKDLDAARAIAARIESGTVWINTHLDFGPNVPFGGAKQSGIGVEFAEEGLKEFTQVQVINQAK
jgi:acyl-CoA reductase-like NAD-dependent aldehyde dehydrogenase